ncbi:MAG TPA: ATP-binding protein [Gemmatimonadaceae bacterium]|nr:ATP-binding protein [Gemmatimonadaceae bacterium]
MSPSSTSSQPSAAVPFIAPAGAGATLEAETAAAISRAALAAESPAAAAEGILDALDRIAPSAGKALALAVGARADEVVEFVAARGVLAPLIGERLPATVPQNKRGSASAPAPCALRGPIPADCFPTDDGFQIPLRAKDRVLGVLRVAGHDRTVREEDVDTLVRLAPTIALALDVLALTEEERLRRERERMLAGALAMMDHPVFIVSTEGRIMYANAAAVRAYGYTRDELTGLLLERLRAIVPGPFEQGDLYHALAENGAWSAESVHRRKDGSTFPAHVAWSLIRGDGDQEVGLVVTARDLSEERRVEEHLRQAEKLAALGELVAGVAHEVNNPLTGISAFAQLLLEDELSSEQHESVRLIKREADRAVGVIRDLLVFARKAPARAALVDLGDVVQRTLRLRTYHLGAADIEVVTSLADDLPGIAGDDHKIQQVVLNLFANAEHSMQNTRRRILRVGTWRQGDRIVLEVADTGTGMSADVRAHIFEPFFTTKPEGAGTGLGLSVSYGIVQAHGGTIDVESSPGVGTTFRIALPVPDSQPSE